MRYLRITEVTVSVLPEDNVNYHVYAVKVQWRGAEQYAVMHAGFALGTDGEWEYEPIPSGRDDDFVAAHRYGYDEALRLANEVAPTIDVNGRTATEVADASAECPMRFTDRWRQRTDDPRRTKGEPALTYEQLLAQVEALEAKAQSLVEPAVNLRKQCDNLIVENARLRVLVGEKTEYAEELAADLGRARSHGICGEEAPTLIGSATGATCLLRHGHASEWHQGEGEHRWKKGDGR